MRYGQALKHRGLNRKQRLREAANARRIESKRLSINRLYDLIGETIRHYAGDIYREVFGREPVAPNS